jgi:hypothetical protein
MKSTRITLFLSDEKDKNTPFKQVIKIIENNDCQTSITKLAGTIRKELRNSGHPV